MPQPHPLALSIHLQLFITEVKGEGCKYPNKLVRKSAQFKEQLFNGNCNLLYDEVDHVTKWD